MTFDLITVPCLEDNYAFLLHREGRTALIDAPDAPPIIAALEERGWGLDEVWITHHHWDHVDGLPPLVEKYKPLVRGASADAHRLPKLDAAHADGDSFDFSDWAVTVMDVSGHTVGHIAYHVPQAQVVFTADSLMALGCGRLFEGTPEQAWESLSRLAALPGDTIVCSGHEYTASNARFALTIEPDNGDLKARADAITAARAKGEPTVPSRLDEEHLTNPFLRAGLHEVKSALDMSGESDAAVFAEIRRRKDSF